MGTAIGTLVVVCIVSGLGYLGRHGAENAAAVARVVDVDLEGSSYVDLPHLFGKPGSTSGTIRTVDSSGVLENAVRTATVSDISWFQQAVTYCSFNNVPRGDPFDRLII